ncbi:MAG TPA: DUF2723 domain-containing protein, partial [Thermoanaerobaculia bacterium]
VTRLPFAARRMWDHDSIQFALGVERYDLAAHHPHPPGYPLYIAILKGLAACGIDSLHGMVALSILAEGIGAAVVVLLGARLVEEKEALGKEGTGSAAGGAALWAGAFAAALYVFNPILWFYGELPLVYAVEAGMTVAVAYAALAMADGAASFVGACALFAIVGGVRQSTMVLLAPLMLYGAWRALRRGRVSWRAGGAGAGIFVAIVLAWLVPMCAAAGGLAEYRRIGAENFATLLPQTSILYGAGWGALAHNLEVLVKWALQGVFPGAVAIALLWAATPRAIGPGLRLLRDPGGLVAAWAIPPILFFALFHVTKAGYTLVHLPALLVAMAVVAAPAWEGKRGRRLAVLGTVVAVVAGGGLFLFGADRRPEQSRAWALVRHEWNRGTIATYERDLDDMIATVRQYSPATTVLVAVELGGTGPAGAEGFLYSWHRHLQWYLPEYTVVMAAPEEDFGLVTRGHEPFRKELARVELPVGTERLLFVLSGSVGDRLPLGPGAVATHNHSFYLTVVPFAGRRALGPLVLVAEPRRRAA